MRYLILPLLFLSFSAQAQSITYSTDKATVAVQEESLHLLGKGYADKKDPTRSIALACIAFRKDGQCEQARFVYWEKQQASYVGQGFYLPYQVNKEGADVINVDALQGALQILLSHTVGEHERRKSDRFVAVGAATAVTGVGFVVGLPFLGLVYSVLFILPREGIDGFKAKSIAVSAHDMVKISRDQNGWSWSERPAKLKTKVFNRVVADLTEPESHSNYYKVPRFQF